MFLKYLTSQDPNIIHRTRPLKAMLRYSIDFNTSLNLDSIVGNKIEKWFKERSKPKMLHAGSLYESVYFYDSQFWTVSIPIIYGEVKLNVFECLPQMPKNIIEELTPDHESIKKYIIDCCNYGMEIDRVKNLPNLSKFLTSADQKIRDVVYSLNRNTPSYNAILECRFALEMFFKIGLTDNEAKKISHNLEEGLSKCIEVSGLTSLNEYKNDLSLFPNISSRYECKGQNVDLGKLWKCFWVLTS